MYTFMYTYMWMNEWMNVYMCSMFVCLCIICEGSQTVAELEAKSVAVYSDSEKRVPHNGTLKWRANGTVFETDDEGEKKKIK